MAFVVPGPLEAGRSPELEPVHPGVCDSALAIVLLTSLCGVLSAQPPPVKWGEVPRDQLEMRTYPLDKDASAVFLVRFATAEFITSDSRMEYREHSRIKILNEAGLDWGTVELSYGKGESIDDIDGQTVNLQPDGSLSVAKLDKNSIYGTEDAGGLTILTFTLPALEPGAVVEYRYTRSLVGTWIPVWYLQLEEPVLHSEFRVRVPTSFEYSVQVRGTSEFDLFESTEMLRPSGPFAQYRWVRTEVPAFRREPFMTSPSNYQSRLDLYPIGRSLTGVDEATSQADWDGIADMLVSSADFGPYLRPGSKVVEATSEIVSDEAPAIERMTRIYDAVRQSVVWTGEYGVWPTRAPREVIDDGEGRADEVNLLLISMLRAANIEAHPILLSTRENGRLFEHYPLFDQFDYLIAYAKIGSEIFLLDATDPLRPHDLLPLRVLNGRGWLVGEGEWAWIDVASDGWYRHAVAVYAVLDSNGTLTADWGTVDEGYRALETRQRIHDLGTEAYIADILDWNFDRFQLRIFASDGIDDVNEKARLQARFTVPGYAKVVRDSVYVNPMVIGRMDENPFQSPVRSFPIDLGFRYSYEYRMSIRLPKGYEVIERPGNVSVRLDAKTFFSRQIQIDDASIESRVTFTLGQTEYSPRQYSELRQMFERAWEADRDLVFLKRTARDPQSNQ